MLKKFIISFLFLIYIFVSLYANICYAVAVTVTDENLSEAFQEFDSNEDDYNITVSNNVINVKQENEDYILEYDLTDKPTFTFEIPIEIGMSYDDFKKQTDNLILPMLGYIAVANIQGAEMEDASTYILFSYLEGALDGSTSSKNSYIIVDDLNVSEGVTIEKTDDPNTIYASEFGDKVMEYVNAVYPETQTISDSEDLNSYACTIEKKDVTETSCKLVSTLSVNTDADFSKLNGLTDGLQESLGNSDITKENADYVVTLKVGQKCKIETSEKIIGYELHNGSCIELAEDYTEITAIKAGVTNGYLYVGEEEKSIYITVEENTGNETLEEITLTIGSIKNDSLSDNDVEDNKNTTNIENEIDNTIDESSELPKAGTNNLMFVIIGILTIFGIFIGFKLKNYKDIK